MRERRAPRFAAALALSPVAGAAAAQCSTFCSVCDCHAVTPGLRIPFD